MSDIQSFRSNYLPLAGVCVYLLGACFQLQWDIPLFILALAGTLSSVDERKVRSAGKSGIGVSLWIFIAATLGSIALSEDVRRSTQMCLPFLPALLIYFLIADRIEQSALSSLYLTLSSLAFGLSLALLWVAWRNPAASPTDWIRILGCPLLIVPNDVTLLAATLPFSSALVGLKNRRTIKALGLLSILLTLAVAGVFKSRVALLTCVVCLACMAVVWRPKPGLWLSAGLIFSLLLADSLAGFPLLAKHGLTGDTRTPLWLSAWRMFLDAPLMGHGPRTFVLFYPAYLRELDLPAWASIDTQPARQNHARRYRRTR